MHPARAQLLLLAAGAISFFSCVNGSLDWKEVEGGLTISPIAKTIASTRTVTISATGGTAPYQFRLEYEGLGRLESADSVLGTVVFRPTSSGGEVNVIVSDSAGLFGVSRVSVPASGSLDTTFKSIGYLTDSADHVTADVHALALQADGKIVVGGSLVNGASPPNQDFLAVRYLENGDRDPSFGVDGVVPVNAGLLISGNQTNDEARGLVVLPDGSLVLGGFGLVGSSDDDFIFVKIDASGSLVGSFGSGGAVNRDFGLGGTDRISTVTLAPSGNIVAAGMGRFSQASVNMTGFAVLEVDASGNTIRTLKQGISDIVASEASAIRVLEDGQYIAAGVMQASGTGEFNMQFARWNAAGAIQAFATLATEPITHERATAVLPMGANFLIAGMGGESSTSGNESQNDFLVARVGEGGILDLTYEGVGYKKFDVDGFDKVFAVAEDGGKIFLAGRTGNPPQATLMRLSEAGQLDGGFGTQGVARISLSPNEVFFRAIAIDSEGRIVVAGSYVENPGHDYVIARYWP